MTSTADARRIEAIAACVRAGDLAGARTAGHAFLEAVADPMRRAPVHYWLGAAAQTAGDLDTALQHYHEAQAGDPGNSQVPLQLGNVHLRRGRLADAEACFRRSLDLDPNHAVAHYNLGVVLQERQDFAGARQAFENAVARQPRFPQAYNNLGNLFARHGDIGRAAQCYAAALEFEPRLAPAHYGLGLLHRRAQRLAEACASLEVAVACDPGMIDAWLALAECHHLAGRLPQAVACAERALAIDPAHQVASFQRARYRGELPERQPPELVRRLFAGMAGSFDDHLIERLGYRVPEAIVELLSPWLAEFAATRGHGPEVLDLGCGTGLFGVAVRARAARLVGVDLSPDMLSRARERGIYDALMEGDLVSAMQPADLIVCADVLIYVGAADEVFAAVAGALRAGGRFAFSAESPADLAQDYRLESSGRYSHHPDYVARLARETGLEVLARVETTIRTEAARPIGGHLYVLGKA